MTFESVRRTVAVAAAFTIFAALAVMPRRAEAQGQAIDGIIEGIVRAQSGDSPVSGAKVRAFNTGTAYERAVDHRRGRPLQHSAAAAR